MPITTEEQEQIDSLIQITQQQIDFFESLDESIMSTSNTLFIIELNHIYEVLLDFQKNRNPRADIQERLLSLAKQLEQTIENRRILQMNAIHSAQYMDNKTLLLSKLATFFTSKTQTTTNATLSLSNIIENLAELSETMAERIKSDQFAEKNHLEHRFLATAPDIILSFIFKKWSDFSEGSPDFSEKMRFLQQMSEEAIFLKKFDIATHILEDILGIYSIIYATRKGSQHHVRQPYHEALNSIARALTSVYKQTLQINKLIDCLEKIQYIYANSYFDKQHPMAIHHLAALAQCYFDNCQALNEANIDKAIAYHQELIKRYKILHEETSQEAILLKIAHTHKHLAELYCLKESSDEAEESERDEIIAQYQQAITYYQYYYYDDEKPVHSDILETLRMLGDFYLENDQYSEAIKIYNTYLEYTADSPQPHTEEVLKNIGLSYSNRNESPLDINKAIGFYSLLLERYKRNSTPPLLQAKIYYYLALAHQKSSKIDNDEVIQENLNNAWLMHIEHAGSDSSGKYDSAVLVVLMDSALAYQKTNQLELARDRLITYKQIYTDLNKNLSAFIYKKTLHMLGEIHQKLGNDDKAEEVFSEGLNIAKQGKNQDYVSLFVNAIIPIRMARKACLSDNKKEVTVSHKDNEHTFFNNNAVSVNTNACNASKPPVIFH